MLTIAMVDGEPADEALEVAHDMGLPVTTTSFVAEEFGFCPDIHVGSEEEHLEELYPDE